MVDIRKSAEVVGLVTVVLSLLFLGYELKRANDIAEAEAVTSMMSEFNGFIALVTADETLWRIWTEGSANFDSLSREDKVRYGQLAGYVYNAYEMSFTYIENGLVDDQYVDYFATDFCNLLDSNDGFAKIYEVARDDRVAGLKVFADTRCQPGSGG